MAQAQSDSEANLHRLRQGTSPFVFAVPLKPRRGCNDWEVVQQRLRHTVRSIRSGVDGNYLILLACHDRPDLDLGEDVLLVPTYTPLRTDETNVAIDRIFFGGINVYLQEKVPPAVWDDLRSEGLIDPDAPTPG